ncbi:MAG: uroporphyrinogen-III C-methyltransferase [Actinomyces sp.]|uniref:uroporphyrinogen-III C-methyltransferase n=1 Tax=Actinomyces sp. TaxID=29317 RepID=UPI0026DD0F06|nr:uroporphyrinogen-III C-methyltransferase [Actinomyces sp.]MDO4243699.1 uroporphyrinogen-III C-methyltransferase [Actinomyces sp.]
MSAPEEPRGTVTLVGGGPGPAGLVTEAGLAALARADVVVLDRLAPREAVPRGTEVIDVGKENGLHRVIQDDINAILVDQARAGRRVVRLKGGDPYVLGRGGEEVAACRAAGIEPEVVPGVTSAIAVPAAAGIPLTHRGTARAFTVLDGHGPLGELPLGGEHTLVILMGVATLRQVVTALIDRGKDPETPAAVIENGLLPHQRVTTSTMRCLPDVAERTGVRPPAVVVLGDVVTLSPHWHS